MPIYEYVCQECGHEFEYLVRGSNKPSCPSCGKGRLAKKFSLPAAHTATAEPSCPVRQSGSCNVSGCGGQGCNLAKWT
jgi:putative FmdB family regulatory protein